MFCRQRDQNLPHAFFQNILRIPSVALCLNAKFYFYPLSLLMPSKPSFQADF